MPLAPDLAGPLRLDPRVALRPEPFGALAYHFGTRRLSFLKSPVLVDVVRSLEHHDDTRAACRAAGVDDDDLPRFEQAVAALVESGMVRERPAP